MPTYEYRCNACGNKWEDFQSIKAEPTKKCPQCKKAKAERIISAGGGIIFKGSGFYQTDYRSESYKKGEEAAKKANDTSTAATSDSAKTDSGKTESKATPPPKKESGD